MVEANVVIAIAVVGSVVGTAAMGLCCYVSSRRKPSRRRGGSDDEAPAPPPAPPAPPAAGGRRAQGGTNVTREVRAQRTEGKKAGQAGTRRGG